MRKSETRKITARLRNTQRKKIDGDARTRLIAAIDDVVDLGARWVQLRETARIAAVAAVELELRPDRDALLEAFRAFKCGRLAES